MLIRHTFFIVNWLIFLTEWEILMLAGVRTLRHSLRKWLLARYQLMLNGLKLPVMAIIFI